MRCSVCAQDVPEEGYAEHLESEHGVTDDPTAVLIQHLTGLHSPDADDADDLPDEEPGDADAFGEFFAARADDDAEAAAEHEDDLPEDEHVGEAEEQLTDDDEAEFERMLATYPDVDLRKGRPAPPEADEPGEDAEPTETVPAAAAVGAAGAAGAAAGSDLDHHDEKTFAVWDEARGAADGEDLPFAATGVEDDKSRRRRQAALVGLAAAIILVVIAVVYLLTRDTSSKKTTATSPSTVATTTAPTFLPGPANGVPTTVPATTTPTQPPVTSPTATPATPATTAATTATTAAPSGDPRSQIAFPSMRGACSNGQLSVAGTVVNNNAQVYSFSFTVTFANSSGGVLGTANGSVAHMPAHSTGPFSASGSCSNVNGAASKTVQITSITPG